MSHKKALITGITGQDGSYLAELLLQKGYEVHGLVRPSSAQTPGRLAHLLTEENKGKLIFHHGDLTDAASVTRAIMKTQPNEIYNLAAQSNVAESFKQPVYTSMVNAIGTLNILEAVRNFSPDSRVFQASSSEIFGKVSVSPQAETTPHRPANPYGTSKSHAFWSVVNARENHNIFAANGIFYNHESNRRPEAFVTRKITSGVARIVAGKQQKLTLGNLDARRDWGFAPDYMEGAYLMLQQEKPEDFVLATGQTHSIKDFLSAAFGAVGLDWEKHVEVDAKFMRPADPFQLVGDPTKAHSVLGWKPRTLFQDIVKDMLLSDLQANGISGLN